MDDKKKPIVVSIMGKAHAGKDTVAEAVMKNLSGCGDITYAHMSHADPLRDILIKILGYTKEQVTTQELKTIKHEMWDKSPREAMTIIGTEMFRNMFDDNTWTKLLKKRIDESNVDVIFITDCRFVNEVEYLEKSDVTHIHVSRNPWYLTKTYNVLRWFMSHNQWLWRIGNKLGLLSFRWHLSELLNLPKYENYRLNNVGTMEELHDECDALTDIIIKKIERR